jgi:DNA-binding transcriptional regulator YdaS (Cro superfamily)
MTLAAYLTKEKLSQSEFGRRVATSGAVVCRWVAGQRTPTTRFALAIERATKGAVTVESWEAKPAVRIRRRAS